MESDYWRVALHKDVIRPPSVLHSRMQRWNWIDGNAGFLRWKLPEHRELKPRGEYVTHMALERFRFLAVEILQREQ